MLCFLRGRKNISQASWCWSSMKVKEVFFILPATYSVWYFFGVVLAFVSTSCGLFFFHSLLLFPHYYIVQFCFLFLFFN